jgi:hypothetical protein
MVPGMGQQVQQTGFGHLEMIPNIFFKETLAFQEK